jgi:protocatechuate 3,4-dioxygenase beta subunit
MRRGIYGVAALAVVIGALLIARCRGDAELAPAAASSASTLPTSSPARAEQAARSAIDPRTLARGRITGLVRARGAAPIAGATVCATWSSPDLADEETREPRCATTDAAGGFALDDLIAAYYVVYASAPRYVADRWHDANRIPTIHVHPGEARDHIDLELDPGAVELRGRVADINGGPVADARVTAGPGSEWSDEPGGSFVRSADDGTFTAWVKPGTVIVRATADGYGAGSRTAAAPGAFVEVLLTPEAVLAGTVVLAGSHAPVAGALVEAGGDWSEGNGRSGGAVSDATGHFRITRLSPGRYKPRATAAGGYGEPAESVLLALGQTVDGVVIELHPAAIVRGTVVLDGPAGAAPRPCTSGAVALFDPAQNRRQGADIGDDGAVTFRAVLPGTYTVDVWCTDHLARDHYDPVVVSTADVTGLVWTVGDGGTIAGRVHTSAGAPVVAATIQATAHGGDPRGQRSWGWQETDRDGTFVVHGLVAGNYDVAASPVDAASPRAPTPVVVAAGAVASVDITVDVGGTIDGTVVDDHGAPVKGANVSAVGTRWSWSGGALTADDGTFTIRGADPGEVRVTARRGWDALRAPGSTDDDTQGKRITIASGQRATVRLVVESQSGTIAGTVVDATGQPIADAYVLAARESDAAGAAQGGGVRDAHWTWERRPVVTATDGTFTLIELAPGAYAVRAYRRGGGEAIAEHVAVGGHPRLVMKPAGAITGTVVAPAGVSLETFSVSLVDLQTGFSRSERFYETGGGFALRELPAGAFTLEVTAGTARATTEVALADGEHRDGLQLTLARMVTVRGRLVELGTTTPVVGLLISVSAARGQQGFSFDPDGDPDRKNITDAAGRFEVGRAPVGRAIVSAVPLDWERSPYGFTRKVVVVAAGQDVVDVGDIELARRRVAARDRGGDLGFSVADNPPDAEPDQLILKISHIDPAGPAAASGLAVGDVIVAVDGIDVRGDRNYLAGTLLDAPQGTRLALGLARGATVAIVAGKPD